MKKKTSLLLLLAGLLLLAPSCRRCRIDKPSDLKPIDWENYNDVYDVYWNFLDRNSCPDVNHVPEIPQDGMIKVCGWIYKPQGGWEAGQLILQSKPMKLGQETMDLLHIPVSYGASFHEVQKLLDSANIQIQKCFIYGKINPLDRHIYHAPIIPTLWLKSADDIHFEP